MRNILIDKRESVDKIRGYSKLGTKSQYKKPYNSSNSSIMNLTFLYLNIGQLTSYIK